MPLEPNTALNKNGLFQVKSGCPPHSHCFGLLSWLSWLSWFSSMSMVRASEPYRESAGQSRSFGPLKIRFLVGWHAVSVVYGTLSAERNVSVVRSIRPWQTIADRGTVLWIPWGRDPMWVISPENQRTDVNHRRKDAFLSAHIDIEPRLAYGLAAHTPGPWGP